MKENYLQSKQDFTVRKEFDYGPSFGMNFKKHPSNKLMGDRADRNAIFLRSSKPRNNSLGDIIQLRKFANDNLKKAASQNLRLDN